MSTIRFATDEAMRSITSQNLAQIDALPHLYIACTHIEPDADPDLMRPWGVAHIDGDGSIFLYERLYPGAVVAPRRDGERVSRGDLLYHGAKPVVDFTPQNG